MKLNKLISSVLVFVMIITSYAALLPITASAASSVTININTDDENAVIASKVLEKCKEYLNYDYDTAYEMLQAELKLGYLDSLTRGNNTIYLNRYTGLMYYVNNVTGQILTSNFIDNDELNAETAEADLNHAGQVSVDAFNITGNGSYSYDSLTWIMQGSLATVYQSGDDSIAIEYILGNASDAFVVPDVMTYDRFNEIIAFPAFEKLQKLMSEYCGDFNQEIADVKARNSKNKNTDLFSMEWKINSTNYNILEDNIYIKDEYYFETYVTYALSNYKSYARAYFGDGYAQNPQYKEIETLVNHLVSVFNKYSNKRYDDNAREKHVQLAPVLKDGTVVMFLSEITNTDNDALLSTYRSLEKAIRYLCPDYTREDLEEHEAECQYSDTGLNVPAFKVSLVYSIDEDGNLIVDVPTNAISYDQELYSISNITVLRYFGAGDMTDEGYAFFPDGSGTVIKFDDFYFGKNSPAINIESKIFGADFCYSEITGAHREQITMPVFGMVSEVNANQVPNSLSNGLDRVTNGFFAIIEEGASLTNIAVKSGGSQHKYMGIYAKFNPIPSDSYDLSESISVSGLTSYTVVAPASYDGKLRIKYMMLVDEEIYLAASLLPEFKGYTADYVSMAKCYRDYLSAKGVLDALEKQDDNAPLYIEVLGSMKVSKKFLSFPITVSEALTEFSDVETMYSELSNAKQTLIKKAEALEAEANELREEDANKYSIEIGKKIAKANEYRKLAEECSNATNVNFKLTGFANGGLHYTYPTKVKWEKSLGGKKGIKQLLSTSNSVNESGEGHFGVYPEFDFMYINNTSLFDGVSPKKSAALMVDNRYASKQSYNSINQAFETLFALAVSSDSLQSLYQKFLKQYSKYDFKGISVSTLGSDLNSNFDSDNPIVREDSISGITSLLSTMSESYSIMADKGNAYTLKYVDHILNASIDSSHFNSSSHSIPFFGMVLHGSVSYAGTPINFSGSPDYEILRSIESGASLYYILCAQNYNYLKEDPLLSQYYGVYYENWFEKIVEQYSRVNAAIGDLQNYYLVDHSILYSERVLKDSEQDANNKNLIDEFFAELEEIISDAIDAKIVEMRNNGQIGKGLKFVATSIDITALIGQASERLNVSAEQLEKYGFSERLNIFIEGYETRYADKPEKDEAEVYLSEIIDKLDYKSKYKYVTDSVATDKDYVYTDYTCANGNVVMVTYMDSATNEAVTFVLNYNQFAVKIKADETIHSNFGEYVDKDGYITLEGYDYVRIDERSATNE